jgi:acetyl esterase/lipase
MPTWLSMLKPVRRSLLAAGVIAATVAGAAAAELPATGLVAGWATGDLTPDRPVLIMGQFNRRVSQRVLDPITCTALAIESRRDGGSVDQAVFVSCDFALPSPALLDELAARSDAIRRAAPGLDPAKIILHATHTHTGPVLEGEWYEISDGIMTPAEYRAFAGERIAAAVVAAWNARRPAAMSWALAHATVAHNRRVVAFDPATGQPAAGATKMYGDAATPVFDSIEGGADTAVSLVFFWSPAGDLAGVIVNLPCPSQETERLEQLSADFWHETRLELKKRLGEQVFVLPQCAAGGDCTSHVIWRKKAEEEMLRRRGLSGRAEIARRIANAVSDALPVARAGLDSQPRFAHAIRTLDLPMQLVTPADRDRCAAEVERSATLKDGFTRAAWHRDVVRRYDEQQATMARGGRPTVPVTVHAIRLGDVAFITNTFELFGDYGVRMQARCPATLTCVVQLAGRGTPGTYLPTARAVEGGGYSAVIESMWVGPAGGRLLVDESVRMLAGLWAPSPAELAERAKDVVEVRFDQPYAGTDNPRQMVDVYLPKRRADDRPLPVIAMIHGGGWSKGDRKGYTTRAIELVRTGSFAAVAVGYRLTDEATWPAQIHDCKAAIRWIRGHAAELGLDPDRIGVTGSSAGGHLVLLLGTSGGVASLEGAIGDHTDQRSGVTCVVNYCGPSDLRANLFTDERSRQPDPAVVGLLGGSPADLPDRAREASPVAHVSADDPPVLTLHGTRDERVDFRHAEIIDAALGKAGVTSFLVPVVGAGHSIPRPPELLERVANFWNRHLRDEPVELSATSIEAPIEAPAATAEP